MSKNATNLCSNEYLREKTCPKPMTLCTQKIIPLINNSCRFGFSRTFGGYWVSLKLG